ncbi:hypothetical protein C7S17_6346 [Burkholderia thailandensis]|nr:hypothetical protein [Burkholderia thailandensis]
MHGFGLKRAKNAEVLHIWPPCDEAWLDLFGAPIQLKTYK